jgi:hypothetical protein
MKYEKPEIVGLMSAVSAIQQTRFEKSSAGITDSGTPAYKVLTPGAYEADE